MYVNDELRASRNCESGPGTPYSTRRRLRSRTMTPM